MGKRIGVLIAILMCVGAAFAQRSSAPSSKELAGITERGRMLYEYDQAVWYGTDAVKAANPTAVTHDRYLARKSEKGWIVYFGKPNESNDKFLISYEARQVGNTKEFNVVRHDRTLEDSDYLIRASRAHHTAMAEFPFEKRPYNVAVLPAPEEKFYVYILPAQTEADVFPLGGDARFTISSDGVKILENRRMHKTILEVKNDVPQGASVAGGYHAAVLDDIPEDSDVFHVLTRRRIMPEYVAAGAFIYKISKNGTISVLEDNTKKKKRK